MPRRPSKVAVVLAGLLAMSLVPPGSIASAANSRQLWADLVAEAFSGKALVVSPDGATVYVAAATGFDGGSKVETIAYQVSSGTRLWTATYGTNTDTPVAIGVSPDGAKVFVSEFGIGVGVNYDYVTLAYDAGTGTLLWASYFDHTPGDNPAAQVISPDGATVYVTGYTANACGDNISTVAFNASDGSERWSAQFTSSGCSDDIAAAIGISPDGTRLFVTGQSQASQGGGGHVFRTLMYDAETGALEWAAAYQDAAHPEDQAFALAVAPDGSRVFVAGCESDAYGVGACAGLPNYVTVAYNAGNGHRDWATIYDDPMSGGDIAKAIGVAPDGSRVYVTGYSDQGATTDYATIAYDPATGGQVWLSAFDGPTHQADYACCLAVSGDGRRIVVTGYGGDLSSTSWSTVGYAAATGSRLWQASYRGSKSTNFPAAVGITRNGTVAFVTGQATAPGYECATVAYRS